MSNPDPRAVVLWLIAEDMYNDAQKLDGQPFTGGTVGTQFGYLQAAILGLASITASILADLETATSTLEALTSNYRKLDMEMEADQ